MLLIADIDAPRHGLIRISPQNLRVWRRSLWDAELVAMVVGCPARVNFTCASVTSRSSPVAAARKAKCGPRRDLLENFNGLARSS